jgi:two-component sensor histidine kinase
MSADWTEMRHLEGKDFIADTLEPSQTWLDKYIHSDDQPRVLEAIDEAIAQKQVFQLEHRVLRADGMLGWMFSRAIPIFGPDGEILEWFGAASDVTARKHYEERLKLLVDELNHRVKNTLASVQSIAMQTLRNAATVTDGRRALEDRLVALAKAHDVLTREHWEGASIQEVVRSALSAYRAEGARDRVSVDGVNIRLLPKAALALSMALHELATNAAKYGALSNSSGRISLSWQVRSAAIPMFAFRWAERGGPPVEEPRRRGFGSRLIEHGLARDIVGNIELSFRREGLICTIEAPAVEICALREERD